MQTLVRSYLAAQELQLLGEAGMSDAIEPFGDKDDSHAIQMYVLSSGDSCDAHTDESDSSKPDLCAPTHSVRPGGESAG